jgi:plastocyanin domain-containing protein
MKLAVVLLACALGLDVAPSCGGGSRRPVPGPPAAEANVVKLTVTDSGFEPSPVKVKAGQAVKLLITRKTDATCATDIVIKDYGVQAKLPLDTEVAVTFTPTRTGELKYGCAMDQMVSGVLLVE